MASLISLRPISGRAAAGVHRSPIVMLAAAPRWFGAVPYPAAWANVRRMAVPGGERYRSLTEALALFSAKRLARAADTHPKTAARWRRGEAAPSGDAVMRMMADDELLVALLRAAGREDRAAISAAEQHLAQALKHLSERR